MLKINKTIIKTFTYKTYTELIKNKEVINEIENLFNDKKINTRLILLAYLIYQFNSEIFYKSDELLELLIVYKSEKLIDSFELYVNDISTYTYNNLLVDYIDFTEKFNEWQKIDANIMVSFMNNSINDMEIYKNMKFTDNIKTQIETKQEFIKTRISLLNQNYPDLKEEKYIKEDIAERAFWELFKESLTRFELQTLNNQDIKWIVSILTEIKDLLNSLTPNNLNIINETNKILDIKFIEQRIVHNSMDSEFLNTLLYFIMDRIKLLQAAVDDNDTNRWIYLTKSLLEYNCHYYDLLPIFFKIVYTKIYRIKDQYNEYMAL